MKKKSSIRELNHWLPAAIAAGLICATVRAEDNLAQQFQSPPATARPGVYAFMLPYGPVPDATIKRDIDEMKAKGLVTCLIYTPGAGGPERKEKLIYSETENHVVPTKEYSGPAVIPEKMDTGNLKWSSEWCNTVRVAAQEAGRLGMQLGVSIEGAGKEPQILPLEYSKQMLVYSTQEIKGPAPVDMTLPISTNAPLNKNKTPLFYRDIAVLAVPAHGDLSPAQVVDLTSRMDSTGHLRWNAPSGDWVILRFGHSVTSQPNVFDHLSAETMINRWPVTTGKLLKGMTPAERKGLTFIQIDSYEGAPQTWSSQFAEEFQKRRGYDIRSWLPVLAGRTVGDPEQSARFQRDYQLTISDLWADNFYGETRKLAHANGLKFYAEAAGPHQTQTDLPKSMSRCDVSMGEFWMPGTHRGVDDTNRFLLRDAAAAAHGYGMNEVFCESFTGGNDCWRESPFHIKPCADQAFCDGLNRVMIHGYSISPWLDADPGVVYWAGTYFNRHITWWNESSAFLEYLSRCSYMLQQGVFAADVAYYNGDGIDEAVSRKAAAMGGLGGHYDYDHINTEILLTRMSVKNGRIVLPDGLSYRLLVLAENQPLPVKVLHKLLVMVKAGATVLGPRPPGPYGLEDDPAEFTALANQLWGSSHPDLTGEHFLGKGRVDWGKSVLQFFHDDGVPPDFECSGVSPKGVIDWIHRKTAAGDIYFVSSRWQPVEQVKCTFRVSGKIPELWDPVTGNIQEAGAFRQTNGCTIVPLKFAPCGSVFVVFRKPTTETVRSGKNWDDFQVLQTINGPWTVNFDPKWGGPQEVTFSSLEDWTKRPESGIKYYSGKATYHKTFNLAAVPGTNTFLDLGELHELASVRLNGHDLGVLWTKPFRVDVSRALQLGANHLEIDVVNLWPNRLTGDAFLPKEKRFTRTNMNKYTQASELLPSGLLGPVTLEIIDSSETKRME